MLSIYVIYLFSIIYLLGWIQRIVFAECALPALMQTIKCQHFMQEILTRWAEGGGNRQRPSLNEFNLVWGCMVSPYTNDDIVADARAEL